jgi:hypothetical protein
MEILMTTHLLDTAVIVVAINGKEHSIDLIDAELFLEDNVDGKPMTEAAVGMKLFLREHTQEEVTTTQAVKFINLVRSAYIEYKKKSDNELKSAFPLAWTHSEQPIENTSFSETASPA